MSIFNIAVKSGGSHFDPITSIPTEKDYQISVVETLAGMPHPDTGVPPAFLCVKVIKSGPSNTSLDIDFARPTKFYLSSSICFDLLAVLEEVSKCLQSDCFHNVPESKTKISSSTIPLTLIAESGEDYIKFQEIKDKVFHVNNINIKTDQLVFIWATDQYKLRLSIGKSKNSFNLINRPDKVSNFLNLECVSLLYDSNHSSQLVLNPWSISLDILLFWEAWQYLGDNPQVQVIAESDCLIVSLCPERIEIVYEVANDLLQFLNELNGQSQVENQEINLIEEEAIQSVLNSQDSEQYYKDDLRAGAFQFVDSTTNNVDEMPLPYQVMFWNKNIAAMAWRYPQPRCLTKIRVFPVPLKVAAESDHDTGIICNLEYWSDCQASFIPYAKFALPENEILHLDLPSGRPHAPFACVWRVELAVSETSDPDLDIFSTFSPKALVACMRIDSYFNRTLISDLNIALSISKLNLTLHTSFNKDRCKILPKFLKGYTSDMMFPSSHCFAEINFDNLKLYGSSWNMDVFLIDMISSFKLSVLDYAFLTMQPMVECSGLKLETSIGNTCNCNFISKSLGVHFSPSIAHTLAVSMQLWNQSYLAFVSNEEEDLDFLVITRYVISNDTNVALKFGQANTDEEITLMPKHFNLYCWRSQKKKQELRVSVESKEWKWSESFSLRVGTQILDVDDRRKLTLNLAVVAVSATQYNVVFSGQLVITNMLVEHFELKVIQDSRNDNKKIINQIVAGNSTTTSMIINYEKNYFLRLRFYGLDTSWTGDIPLMEHSKSVQPWLVKVPLLEKGQFLSIWCRVVVQDFENGKKILAMLWPLFSIKSNLPTNTKVHIETPTLNYSGELLVKGQGELQQLYCPGTIDHAHQLTFQLENVGLNPNPYVPMNYSLIDHQTFFKKMNKVDIQDILESLKACNEVKWPYFGDELDDINLIIGEQPETHVQVKYQNACPYSSSLMVELLPWCLLVNTLGCTIGIKMEGTEVCTLRHNGIVAPPKMEENFNICVYIDGEKFISDPLHFAKPATWSPNFYMPKILGIIPADGTIVSNVKCKKHICRLSIKSWMANEIRLLKVGSTHIICNNTGFPLHVMCVAVPDTDTVYSIPHHLTSGFITIDSKICNKNRGVSVTQWFNIGRLHDQSGENDPLLYMLFSGDPSSGWSKPIRVDDAFTRKTVSITADAEPIPLAITSHIHNGQHFISIQHDARPQLYIDNISGVNLYCAQAREGEESGAVEEAEHFTWFCEIKNGESNYYSMSSLTAKFPEIPVHPIRENLVFTKDPSGGSWSLPVNISEDINQYVKIPFHGDVRIVLKNTSCLTYIRLESVSRVEINAKDIRSRLKEYEELISSNNLKTHHVKHNVEESKIMYSQSAEAISSLQEDVDELNHQQYSLGDIRTRSEEHPKVSRIKRRKSDSQLILIRKMEKKLFCATIPMMQDWKSLTAKFYVNEFTFTLLSDIEIQSGEVNELAALVCDNIAISLAQSESMEMNVYVQNMQLDNQLYSKKNFDFPVVMLLQEPKNCRKLRSLSVPIETLFEDSRSNAAMELTLVIDTWKNQRQQKVSGIQELIFHVQPISCYIEDTYLMLFSEYLHVFLPTSLVYIPEIPRIKLPLDQSTYVNVPDIVIWQTMVQSRPLTIRHLVIRPISVMMSIHSSMKVYLALDQSPLSFIEFERKRMYTNAYRLGHTLTMHYLSGAIFRAGWMVSSLEILGSPVGLARAMGSGLKDFVALPFRGLLQGPVEFLYGVTHGSASLMRHVTAGTLQSVTKMASSMARNLDYLTLDEEHVRRAEELRRQRPSGVTEGLIQGLTGLGISILGAIGGIAHHPLQSVISEGGSPRSLAAGLGLGLVGIITKPLSGAAELLALTGQGLLQGAGWNNLPEQRNKPVLHNMFSSNSSILKYEWKFTSLNDCKVLHMSDATSICPGSEYTSVALIITNKNLVIMNVDDDVIQNVINLSQLECIKTNGDPTLLSFELVPLQTEIIRIDDDINIEMDPASRARVADYVKNTVGLIQAVNKSKEPSEMSISPLSSPGGRNDENLELNTVLSFYVNSQDRNYFLCLLSIAKHENLDCSNNYPVL
ncbi:hypothetical protein WA026_006901 [Henosepilachna vigintioctopunctata]|uniref:Vacuolar protein sorting-associated protein 13 VPS13 adaptor binding domain-containing protein n=1 Tax=Henosepilachna vigintioctopunctata TaxID=420089 RepID=A0AAW1VBB9_9CUCU